jgi:hypothetical protein
MILIYVNFYKCGRTWTRENDEFEKDFKILGIRNGHMVFSYQ